jgi:hypothetical protein
MKLKELKQIIKEEIKKLKESDSNIVDFLNQHLDEVKEYVEEYFLGDTYGLEDDEIEDRKEAVDSISEVTKDLMGDATIMFEEGYDAMGVSFQFADKINKDEFKGGDGSDDPEIINIGGKKIGVIWYNI